MKNYNHVRGWFRCIVWGYCPMCNSDGPKIDTCRLCKNDRSYPFNWLTRKHYWKWYKVYLWANHLFKNGDIMLNGEISQGLNDGSITSAIDIGRQWRDPDDRTPPRIPRVMWWILWLVLVTICLCLMVKDLVFICNA